MGLSWLTALTILGAPPTGAWPSPARTLFHHGMFLMARESDSDRHLGLQQWREAERLARRLEMAGLVADIEASLRGSSADVEFPDDLKARASCARSDLRESDAILADIPALSVGDSALLSALGGMSWSLTRSRAKWAPRASQSQNPMQMRLRRQLPSFLGH